MPNELSVLVVAGDVAGAAIDVLTDWSASGIVDPILVVDETSLRPKDFRVPAHLIVEGRSYATSMQSYLADQVGIDLVRLVALGRVRVTSSMASAEVASEVLKQLQQTLPGARTLQAQVIGTSHQGETLPATSAWLGWHNIVVAPEDSLAPGSGVERLASDAPAGLLDTHLLTSVCTIAGAWAHADGSPLDDDPPLPGNQVTLFRSFTRLLSAQQVENELLGRIISVADGYPLPMVGNERAWAVEDQGAAAQAMADQLLTKHHYVMPQPRVLPPREPVKVLGFWEAFRLLWGFLWSALVNAPRRWVESTVHRFSTGMAALAQRTVFGTDDSEYEVVVRGIRSDGTPASWADIDQMSAVLASRIGPSGSTQTAGTDLSALWRDFAGGAMTLLDGESRSPELPPIAVGAHRGIVTTPGMVVPDPRDLMEPSGAVGANIRGWKVEPADLIQAHALEAELQRVAHGNTMLRTAATADRERLQTWRARVERSYTGRVGHRLGRAVVDTREEVMSLAQQLAGANSALELPNDIEERQRRVATKLRWILLGALVAVAVTVTVIVLNVIGPIVGTAIATAIVLIWVLSSVVVFMRGQQELFQLLNARKDLGRRAEILQEFLGAAVGDLRRLVRAYRQYLDWTRALGTFVAAPNGVLSDVRQQGVALGAGLPRSIAFGEVQPDPAVLDDVAARLRNEILKAGWLSASWESFLADVPEQLGTRAYEVRENPDAIWVDQGSSDRSLLSAWSGAVDARGVAAGSVDGLRQRVRTTLAVHPAGLVEQLSATIRTRSTSGTIELVSYRQFIAGLRDIRDDNHVFDQSVFTDIGAAGEPWRIAPGSTWTATGAADLGGSVVVAQRSRAISVEDLVFGAEVEVILPQKDESSPPGHPVM
ncbi:hypothetical protein ASE01_12155 [Nocardioides sp. Root190]|uniref:hypothetical protein n=1 Tax=Nocardioides sp. Root190 TaxID=1736488 RepID=UPI0006F4CE27|nr:hypothetical protein [Nocardioides sp. Root190]KRB75808.1 hypothetical protein ASE01_12155 [Nocardioides sp. Root190]